jgi:hypothetical protein
MSKYALKLEQLVQTDKYGDLLVTIQYDAQGPKLVTVNGDKLQAEVKHMLDTVLGLINFNLTKGIKPAELAEQLEIQPEDGIRTPLNDLLLVVGSSLKEAPEGVNQIGGEKLMDIAPAMVAEFTRSAGNVAMDDKPMKPSQPMGGRGNASNNNAPAPKPAQPQANQAPSPKPTPTPAPAPKQAQPPQPQGGNNQGGQPSQGGDDKKGFFGGFRERK